MPLDEYVRDDMRSMHAKFYGFSMHRDPDMNISLIYLFKFCTPKEQALRKVHYMKDVVFDEGIPTKLNSSI
jgi:hypothetical protein